MDSQEVIKQRVAGFLKRKRMEEAWRDGSPISQSEMAGRMGIAQGSLSQYESGTRLPEGDNMHKIAAYLGVEFYDILNEPRSIPDNPLLKLIIEAWGHLPKDVQKKFANLVQDEAEVWKERSSPPKASKKEVKATS